MIWIDKRHCFATTVWRTARASQKDNAKILQRKLRPLKWRRKVSGKAREFLVSAIISYFEARYERHVGKHRQRAGIEAAKAEGVYRGRRKNVDDEEICRRIVAGAGKADVARQLKVSRMTVYRALNAIVPTATEELPGKPPSATVALHLIVENFDRYGRGRKTARERIEAMLERDFAMVKTGKCDYRLTVTYDSDPDGVSLDDEIEHLQTEILNIAERHRCSIEVDMHETGGQERVW